MTRALHRDLAAGVAWNYAASATTLLAQVGYAAATARLLSPRDFGAYAAALGLSGLAAFVGFASIGNALVRLDRLTDRLIGTAAVATAIAGVAAAAICWAVAPVWAAAWHVPEAEPVVRVLALGIVSISIGVVPLSLLRRAFRFRAAASIESGGQLLGLAVGVVAAARTGSPIALAAGQVTAVTAIAVMSTALARRELRVSFGRAEARELLSFATQVSAQNIGYYALYTTPSWVIARSFGSAALGFYSRAYSLVWLPLTHLSSGLTKVMYPMYSRASGRAEHGALVERTLLSATAVIWPMFAAAAGAAGSLVAVLMGPGWETTAELLRPLLLLGACNIAFVISGNPLEARRHLGHAWAVQGAWGILLAIALAIALLLDLTLMEMVVGLAVVQMAAHAIQVAVVAELGYLRRRVVAAGYSINGVVAFGFFCLTLGVDKALSDFDAVVRVAASGALTVAVAALAFPLVRRMLDTVLAGTAGAPEGARAAGEVAA